METTVAREVSRVIAQENRKAAQDRRRQIQTRIESERRREAERKATEARVERGRQAEAQFRQDHPVVAVISYGDVTVEITLADVEGVRRRTAEEALRRAIAAFSRHVDEAAGATRAPAMNKQPAPVVTFDKLYTWLADDIRASVKHGNAIIKKGK